MNTTEISFILGEIAPPLFTLYTLSLQKAAQFMLCAAFGSVGMEVSSVQLFFSFSKIKPKHEAEPTFLDILQHY